MYLCNNDKDVKELPGVYLAGNFVQGCTICNDGKEANELPIIFIEASKMNITFKNIKIKVILSLMIVVLSACSSPEDKANKFYENGMLLLEKGELVKANVEFRNAVQLNRKLTKAIWGQVLVTEKQNKPREQYKLLKTVLINEPDHLEALVKISRLLLLAGQLDKALEKSDLSMKINDQDLSVLSLRAAVMLKLDDAPAAIKLAKQVLSKDSDYVDALIILATERLTAGDATKAIEYLDQGLLKNEKNIALHLIKIKALEKLNKLDLVEVAYKKIINFYPKTRGFKTILAQFYIKNKRMNDAENIFKEIIKNNPSDLKAKIKLVQFINGTKGSDAGLKQLQSYSQETPNSDELKFAVVQFHIVRKEIKLANELLRKIISEKPNTDAANKAKGIMAASLLAKGDKSSAEKVINEILAVDKQNQNGLILKASIDIDRQKYDGAIAALRLVLRDDPNSSRALFFLARAHNLSGSPELADEQYFKAFKTSKFNPAYGMSYAQFLLKRKQPQRAEKILEDMLGARKGGLPALKLLAQTRLQLGDWVGAQQIADTIKKIGDKSNLAGQINNAIMVGKKDYNQSIALLKRTYQSTPGNIQPVVALVRTYLLAGKTQEAGNFLDAVINASPKNISARILRGQIYSSEGKVQQAISSFEKAIKQDATNTVSYYHLAVAYMRTKDFNKANEILNKGLVIAPKDFSLGITLAQMYEATNQINNAINTYEKLLKVQPDADIVANNLASLLTENRTDKASLNKAYALSQRFKRSEVPQFKDTFGWASYRVGKYTDAASLLESAIKQLPNIPDFHYHLGMNYLAKENKAMAKISLEKALDLAGGKGFAKEKEIRAVLEKL